MTRSAHPVRLGIAGTGAIGATVAKAVDAGDVPGMELTAIAASGPARFHALQSELARPVDFATFEELAESCDWVIEAGPPKIFEALARPVLDKGKTLVVLSCSQLPDRDDLIARAQETGARIVVPSGAILGLDALKAAAVGTLNSVTIETRKPVAALIKAPYVASEGLDLTGLSEPMQVFSGSVSDGARAFPANVNVAAALALAGFGAEQTRMQVWADPTLTRNQHRVHVVSDSADLTMTIEGRPSPQNPATGLITAQSVIALLKDHTATLKIGT